MTKRMQDLVIPASAQFKATDDGFSIGNLGDVVINGQPSLKLQQLSSTQGSVHLHSDTPLTLTRIEAPNGEVRLSGSLVVHTVLARKVSFLGGSLHARSLVAEEEITIQGESVQTDIIIAPRVRLSERVKGRATVIESKNDLGPTLLKGVFRLDEYLEIFPNGRDAIEQNADVKARLEGWKDLKLESADAGPAVIDDSDEPDSGVLPIREPEAEGEVLTLTDAVGESLGNGETGSSWTAASITADSGIDLPTSREEGAEDLYNRLSESFLKIMGCYSDLKLPPPLNTLENLIEERRFDALRKQLTGLWNELLQYHKREGLHIANAVTHNIQEMKKLLQDRA